MRDTVGAGHSIHIVVSGGSLAQCWCVRDCVCVPFDNASTYHIVQKRDYNDYALHGLKPG